MKKILAKLAQVDSDDAANAYNNFGGGASSHHASFIGRQFDVGHFSLVVEDTIAEGGFGMVFRVRSQQGQHYALKRTCVNSEQDLAVCKREITIVSSLSHKNILRYIDSRINRLPQGVYEVLLLTVFYRVSLSQFLQERRQMQQRLTEVEVLRVFCDVCEAVCRLHHCKTPIIHRDLKAENILIDERQNFVLCDFGSATSRVLLPSAHGLVRCKEEIDKYTTLAYRAPELIDLYSSIPLGPQIDIWAMGCLLYFLCFGVLPFGDSALAIQSGNYSLPDSSPYSERLHKLIGCLLCVDAYKRPDIFQTCALAFSLSGRTNPAQNLNNLPVPRWQDLVTPPRESQLKAPLQRIDRANSPQQSPPSKDAASRKAVNATTEAIGNTSVVPRQRPRATATCPIPALPSVSIGTVRPDTTDSRSILTTASPKPPPPPPPPPAPVPQVHVPQSAPQSGARMAETRGHSPFPGDSQPFGEHSKRLAWETTFSESFEPEPDAVRPMQSASAFPCPPTETPTTSFRGHQRTWSADVGYMNRVVPVFSSAARGRDPGTTELTHGVFHSHPVWEPFSSQLRQVQSLVSLPTSTVSTDLATDRVPGTMARVGQSRRSPAVVFSTSMECGRIHDAKSVPEQPGSQFTEPSTTHRSTLIGKPHLIVDEDVLFGAAFDAIRKNSHSAGCNQPTTNNTLNSSVSMTAAIAAAAGWENTNRSDSIAENGAV